MKETQEKRAFRPVLVDRRVADISPSRGEQPQTVIAIWENKQPTPAANVGSMPAAVAWARLSAACQPCGARSVGALSGSEMPAQRFGDQKVAKNLHARHRLELLGIDEIRIERRRIAFTEE